MASQSPLAKLSNIDVMPESRKHRRVPFAADARAHSSTYKQDGSIANLSLGGCFFSTAKPSRTGEVLHISFYVSGMVLRGKGVVRHVLPKSGMGIEFSDVSPEFRAALSFLISPKQ